MSNLETSRFAPMLRSLEEGNLSPSQLSAVSQALHVGMLNSALTSIQESDALLSKLKVMEDRALEFLEARFEEFLPVATHEELIKYLTEVSKIRSESIKAKLSVYKTRDLFNISPISEDDRALLSLFKMINSEEKKQRLSAFLKELSDDVIDIPSPSVNEDFEDEE